MRDLRRFLEAQGRKRGKAEGLAEGEAKGLAEGEAKGKQDTLLKILRARGLPPGREDEARIRGCADGARLDRWFDRAITASALGEVFGRARRAATKRATSARRGSASAPSRSTRRASGAGVARAAKAKRS
jgi:hypothetical protein